MARVAGRGAARVPRARTRPAAHAAPALTALAMLVAAGAWLPFLHMPLGADESGFLLLSQHWHNGDSLYGNYWVDRPPLLLWLFILAGHMAPATPAAAGVIAPGVKALGAISSAASVALTVPLTRMIAPAGRRAWVRPAAVWLAVTLLASPLFGLPELDGELLALPFALAGLVCLVAALRKTPVSGSGLARARHVVSTSPRDLLLAAAAGGLGMCAALVKQDVIDVFVFAAVAWAPLLMHRRSRLRRPDRGSWARLVSFAAGALSVLGVALAAAAARGTSPAGLWTAIVVFRFQATAVIGSSASAATSERMSHVLRAAVQSGAVAVLVLTVAMVLRAIIRGHGSVSLVPADLADGSAPDSSPGLAAYSADDSASEVRDLTWPVLAVVAWEISGVLLGGSYWLHYLTGLVPGLVLLVGIAPLDRWGRRLLVAALAYATVANLSVWTQHATTPAIPSADEPVITYLRDHARPSDGVVVAFGHADIVAATGLTSPYPELWSLPVRVRDPQLLQLRRVLAGPDAPLWMVVAGGSLASWGLNADAAQRYLIHHYAERVDDGDWTIWRRHREPSQSPLGGRQP